VTVNSGGAQGNGLISTGGQGGASSTSSTISVVPQGPVSLRVSWRDADSPGASLQVATSTGCAYINREPRMPYIEISVLDSNGQPATGEVTFTGLTMSFDRLYQPHGRNTRTVEEVLIHSYLANPPQHSQDAGSPWAPSLNSAVRGGMMTISYFYGGQQYSHKVCVRALNPTYQTVNPLFDSSPDYGWFKRRVANHETNASNFCESGRMAIEYCGETTGGGNNFGSPVFGRPRGYGFMQLDPPPNYASIWDWRNNLEATEALLFAKAGPKVIGPSDTLAYQFWLRQVFQFKQLNQ
jgi:hypothetical protein